MKGWVKGALIILGFHILMVVTWFMIAEAWQYYTLGISDDYSELVASIVLFIWLPTIHLLVIGAIFGAFSDKYNSKLILWSPVIIYILLMGLVGLLAMMGLVHL